MIAYYKTEVPFLRLIFFFVLGIVTSILQNITPNLIYNFAFYSVCGVAIITLLVYRRFKIYLFRGFTGILIYVSLFLAGLVITNQRKQIFEPNHFSKTEATEFIGVVNEKPKIKGDIARFIVNVKYNVAGKSVSPSTGKLLVALRFDSTQNLAINYGDLLLLKAKYKETEPPYNFAEFNYRRYLSLQNVYHQTFINRKQIDVIGKNEGNPIIAFALHFRDQQIKKFNRFLTDNDAKAVASTLILGYRENLDKHLLSTYSNTGTMHVLSVSGMHVAIVAMLLNFMLSFMNRNQRLKIIKAVIIISLIWFYALITGLAPSVTRAALMISFVLIARAKSRSINIFNVLAISAFVILLFNPFALLNVGFQLSYIAVGGLIYLYPKVQSWYQPQNKILKAIWSVMAVSISAQIATAPFSLFYFHQFPVYFILSNVFIVIPATLIMYSGFAFLLVASFIPNPQILADILEKLIQFTNGGLQLLEKMQHANVTMVWLNMFEIMLCYFLIAAVLFTVENKKFLWFSAGLLVILVLSLTVKEYQHVTQRNVTFFALRKNTAVAFVKGRSAVLITDLEKDDFTYLFSVKPYLDSCHVNTVEFINPYATAGEKLYKFEGKVLKVIDEFGFSQDETKVDWILFSADRKANLDKIALANKFLTFFIDGKNRDFVIEHLKNQAKEINLPVRVLKREFAAEYRF